MASQAPKPTASSAAALALFRTRLYEAMMAPNNIPLDDVMRTWQVWEATMVRDEIECQTKIQRYLEHPHSERLEHTNRYIDYKQYLQQTCQAYESATLGDQAKKRRDYVTSAMKPIDLLKTPSSIYTTSVAL
jgi:hypothetical protein